MLVISSVTGRERLAEGFINADLQVCRHIIVRKGGKIEWFCAYCPYLSL